jgi:murein DD-endopeptidase MepM/ murein hydrolase activator NlpD
LIGEQFDPSTNNSAQSPHYGIDYAGNTGDPVKASADGTVTLSVADMFYSSGTMVMA